MSQTRPLLEQLLPAPHHVIRFPDLKHKFKPQRAQKRTHWINNFFLAVLILIAIWVFAFGVSLSIKAYEDRKFEGAGNHTSGAVLESTQKQKLPARISAAGLSVDGPRAGDMNLTRNSELEAFKRRPEAEKPGMLEIFHDVQKLPDLPLPADSMDEHLQKTLESLISPDEVAHGLGEEVYYNMEGNHGDAYFQRELPAFRTGSENSLMRLEVLSAYAPVGERGNYFQSAKWPNSHKHHKKKKHRKSFAVRGKSNAGEQYDETVPNKKGSLIASDNNNGSFTSEDFDNSLPNTASKTRAEDKNPNHTSGNLYLAKLGKENSGITGQNTSRHKMSDMSSEQMLSIQTIDTYQERARRSIEPEDGNTAESKEHNVVKKVLPEYGRNHKKNSEPGNGNMIPNNSSPKSEGSAVKHYFMDPLQLEDWRASKKRVHRTRRESPAETDNTRKSVEKIWTLKSEAEQKEAAEKADRMREARAIQLEKDRALMREMFDNAGEETSDTDDFAEDDKSTDNTEDMDSSEGEEQPPGDYAESQESFADAETAESYARSEPYAPVESQEAEDFDTDDITKKQHDNSKAQWPHRWADKFKNLVNGENYHDSDDSAQQFDNYESNEYEQETDSGMSSEDESTFDQESQYEESDDSKNAESNDSSNEAGSEDVQLDAVSEDEKDEMQFTDTSKNQYPQEYDTSNAQMDAEQSAGRSQTQSDRYEKGREKDAVSRELERFFGRPQEVDRRQRADVSYRSFPQEDVNLLKEVMLTPLLLQPSAPAARASRGRPQTRFSTESDVKMTPRTRPFSSRDRTGTPSALVNNVLTLNINFGPDAMVKVSPDDDDGDDDTDDRSPKQGKTINLNVMRTGRQEKDIAADLRNEGQDQKGRRKQQAGANASVHRDSEESEDDADDDDSGDDGFRGRKSAYTNDQHETSQVSSRSNRKPSGGASGQRRKRIPLQDVEQFDMDLTELRSNKVRAFPARSNHAGDVIAIKLGSINGDGGQRSN